MIKRYVKALTLSGSLRARVNRASAYTASHPRIVVAIEVEGELSLTINEWREFVRDVETLAREACSGN